MEVLTRESAMHWWEKVSPANKSILIRNNLGQDRKLSSVTDKEIEMIWSEEQEI